MALEKKDLDAAFQAIGEVINANIAIVVGGSAVFVLAGSTQRPANDCDLLIIQPENQQSSLLAAADQVCGQRGLEEGWLNDAMGTWNQDAEDEGDEEAVPEFPSGWQDRLQNYRVFGRLTVQLLGRADALALKARTTQERGDRTQNHESDLSMLEEVIRAATPTVEEFDFAISYLNGLDHIDPSRIVATMLQLKDEIHPPT